MLTPAFAQSATFSSPKAYGSLAAWFTAYTNEFMAVNTDGTGGAPANGGTVRRWIDRSGNNNHVTQTNVANSPVWRASDGLNFRSDSGGNTSDLRNNATTAIPRRNSSGAMVVWLPGANTVPLVDFGTVLSGFALMTKNSSLRPEIGIHTGAGYEFGDVKRYLTSRRCVVGWRSNASEFQFRVNGVTSTHAALSTGNMTDIFFGTFNGGAPQPLRIFEAAFYAEDIGATKMEALERYLRRNAGPLGNPTHTVTLIGDSLTVGFGSDTLTPWHDPTRVTNRITSVWYPWAGAGGLVQTAEATEAALINAIKGSVEGVVVMWIGINDIITNARTGAQVHGDISSFCTTLRTTGGHKVIVCTLPSANGGGVARTDLNTLLKANYTSYADAIVKLDEDAALDDYTDTTYYLTDGVHFKDAGYAVIAGLIQTAMANL